MDHHLYAQLTQTTMPSDDDFALQPQSSLLLTLKSWQQDLLTQLAASEATLRQAYQQQERQKRLLAALTYEQEHLDGELETCRNFELKYLKQLAREEAGGGAAEKTAEGDDDDESELLLLSTFLKANVHDPNDKQAIILRLHEEINARGSLGRDLKLKQQELQKLQEELDSQNSFLKALPDHLAVLERASLPLQKFVATKQPPNGSNAAALMIGTERQQRLDLARSLPPPLYTLFQQLQHYLDRPSSTHDDGSNTPTASLSITTGEEDQQVVLLLPVPDVTSPPNATPTSGRTKSVKIHFHYTQGLVTAVAKGCGTTLNQDILLDELFPNDHASSAGNGNNIGRPYHWCNYLAGIHTVPESSSNENTVRRSTRVVVRELQRRVRANATLKHILYSLQRQHVPAYPSAKKNSGNEAAVGSSSPCKLLKFELDKDQQQQQQHGSQSCVVKTFSVTIVCGKNDARHGLQVDIHMARYPVVTPVWKLNITSAPDATPLYYDQLAAWERYVNVDGLEALVRTAAGGDEEEGDDETAYEWILLHQLRHILQSMGEDYGQQEGPGGRLFKGRDHAPITT